MTEREPRNTEEAKPVFADTDAVIGVLKGPASEQRDFVLGVGRRFTIPEGEEGVAGELTIYPDRRLVLYRNSLVQLDLGNVTAIEVQGQLVQIEASDRAGRSAFFLQADGSFTLNASGLPGARRAAAQQQEQDKPSIAPPVAGEDSKDSQKTTEPGKGEERAAEEPSRSEKPQRVVLTGRVGRAPQLRETPTNRQIARMPLAVPEGEKTVWHSVVFFGEKAKQAAAELTKGEIVTIVGYKHLRQVPTKFGLKQVEQIFAAAVKKPKTNPNATAERTSQTRL